MRYAAVHHSFEFEFDPEIRKVERDDMTVNTFARDGLARTASQVQDPVQAADQALRLPLALGSRVANIVATAQVQWGYACASRLREGAERSIEQIRASWPASPVRDLVEAVYRAQARSAQAAAEDLLSRARRSCGLAYSRCNAGPLPKSRG